MYYPLCFLYIFLYITKFGGIPSSRRLTYDYSNFNFSTTYINIQWMEVNTCVEQREYYLIKVLQETFNSSVNHKGSLNAIIMRNESHFDFSLFGYYVHVISNGIQCLASDTLLKFPNDCKFEDAVGI